MTQKDRVLQHLQEHGSITSWQAIMEYGATRLADIVFKLRQEGYDIESECEKGTNRFGDKIHWTKYKLKA